MKECGWKATTIKEAAFVFPVVSLIHVNTFVKKEMAH